MTDKRDSILFERLHEDVEAPARATAGSAGYDLKACLTIGSAVRLSLAGRQYTRSPVAGESGPVLELRAGERAIIPLGFRAALPAGFEAQIRPRSGTSFRTSLAIANSPGTIDPDYNLEWGVLVRNDGTDPIVISHRERIAQMVIARYEVLDFEDARVQRTTDRDGGFGSTGSR